MMTVDASKWTIDATGWTIDFSGNSEANNLAARITDKLSEAEQLATQYPLRALVILQTVMPMITRLDEMEGEDEKRNHNQRS